MLLSCALFGSTLSLFLWFDLVRTDTVYRKKSFGQLCAALGLSHGSFVLLLLHIFVKG